MDHSITITVNIENYLCLEKSNELSGDIKLMGKEWRKVQLNELKIEKGVYLIAITPKIEIRSQLEKLNLGKILFIDHIEESNTKNDIFPNENCPIEKEKNIQPEKIKEFELWFLPTPEISLSALKSLKEKLIDIFNPPYNTVNRRFIKATIQVSKPAF